MFLYLWQLWHIYVYISVASMAHLCLLFIYLWHLHMAHLYLSICGIYGTFMFIYLWHLWHIYVYVSVASMAKQFKIMFCICKCNGLT